MYKRKQIEIICDGCGTAFEKAEAEVKRNNKKGMRNFCSLKCVGKNSYQHLKTYAGKYDIAKHSANHKDEYTGLREFLRRIKVRQKSKDLGCNLTLEYLKFIWEDQNHKCAYTGIELSLPKYIKGSNNIIFTASLDRIDSSKGYVEGNVQFVSMAINYMKSTMTDEQTKEIIKLIKLQDEQGMVRA